VGVHLDKHRLVPGEVLAHVPVEHVARERKSDDSGAVATPPPMRLRHRKSYVASISGAPASMRSRRNPGKRRSRTATAAN
jgi:hypothetical protein